MLKQVLIIFAVFSFMTVVGQAAEETNVADQTIVDFVKDSLKEKTKYTGSVDLYDDTINKVRHLDLMDLIQSPQKEGRQYFIQGKFHDGATGDIVTLKIIVEDNEGKLVLTQMQVQNVDQVVSSNQPEANRHFSDQEIQDLMLKYLAQKAAFTGTFDIFDEKVQKMRNLLTGQFQKEVRRFGTRYISRVDCQDVNTKEKVELDLSVESQNGLLEVKSVRIFSVKKEE